MNGRQRTILLAVIMGVLGLLVVFDRMGGSAPEESEESGLAAARDAYVREAMALERERTEVAQREAWERVVSEARARRGQLDDQLLVGQTRELAAEELRNRVKRAMRELGLNENGLRAQTLPVTGQNAADTPIQVISSEIAFVHSDPAVVYQLIERLENLSGVRTMISSVKITGPGRALKPAQIDVNLTIHALALIGKETGA
ncbi:MAG: hypothetical protein KDA21_11050 [Phycisphaerales bacterium]|nr:hypothetical protein [Phycisphaerales bacterium]